ncbi:hypothetical protein BX600DRAFT_431080 [Xylariales sp. PMI_506]|nr:hypothetical protein BX600DRAFT_431080 [Xylariales sp. PMI_506]
MTLSYRHRSWDSSVGINAAHKNMHALMTDITRQKCNGMEQVVKRDTASPTPVARTYIRRVAPNPPQPRPDAGDHLWRGRGVTRMLSGSSSNSILPEASYLETVHPPNPPVPISASGRRLVWVWVYLMPWATSDELRALAPSGLYAASGLYTASTIMPNRECSSL